LIQNALLFHQHLWQNFTASFRQQHLHRVPYFGAMLPNAVAIKNVKNELRKSCSDLATKMLVKLTLSHPQRSD